MNFYSTADDKLFLYEATGMLIVTGSFTPEQKQQYMQQLLGNLWDRFSEACQQLNRMQADAESQKLLYDYLNNIVAFARFVFNIIFLTTIILPFSLNIALPALCFLNTAIGHCPAFIGHHVLFFSQCCLFR